MKHICMFVLLAVVMISVQSYSAEPPRFQFEPEAMTSTLNNAHFIHDNYIHGKDGLDDLLADAKGMRHSRERLEELRVNIGQLIDDLREDLLLLKAEMDAIEIHEELRSQGSRKGSR